MLTSERLIYTRKVNSMDLYICVVSCEFEKKKIKIEKTKIRREGTVEYIIIYIIYAYWNVISLAPFAFEINDQISADDMNI